MTAINLFRGQCIGVKVEVIATDCIVTLDLEDYNRLPPLIAVGAPVSGGSGLVQADGTVIGTDVRAQVGGIALAMREYPDGYWPVNGLPDLDLATGFLATDVPANVPTDLGLDWGIALSNLKSFIDAQIVYISGGTRWWIGLPETGDDLILYVVDFDDPAQVVLLPAPYEIDNDNPDWSTRIMPMKLGPVSWEWAGNRDSAYIRGGTPAGEGSGWGYGTGGGRMGDAYINAPGSITLDDRTAIAEWHQAQEFIAQLTLPITMMGGWPDGGSFVQSVPWRVGQTVLVTSANHSRITGMIAGDRELDAHPCVIQGARGRLVTPAGGLTLTIDGVTMSEPYEWQSFTFESILSGSGKATVVIHLLGAGDTLGIGLAADVKVTMDDTLPVDIEWGLTVGTMSAGSLTRELAKLKAPEFVPPTYRFNVTENDPDGVKRGLAEQVAAQIATGPSSPIALSGVPMEWILIQWEDDAESIVGNMLELTDDIGTTDSGGRVFNTLTPDSVLPDGYNWEISAVALPI